MRIVRCFIVLLGLTASGILFFPRANADVVTPVSSCPFVATTDVKVTSDLPCAGTSGIVVARDGVTIDLNGHTLTGDRTQDTYGIDDNGCFDGVTVKNGTVTRFNEGIYASDGGFGSECAFQWHVSRVLASGNSHNGILIEGDLGRVTSSEASGNGNLGIAMDGDASQVTSSQATGNASFGIWSDRPSARITSSFASGNLAGIVISADSSSVKSSQASGNAQDGIRIEANSARVTLSRAFGNGGIGINIVGNAASISSSRASGNGVDGIVVSGDGPRIGQLPGRPASEMNHADANGFASGTEANGFGQGIYVHNVTTTAATGRNEATGNDDPAECNPSDLCP